MNVYEVKPAIINYSNNLLNSAYIRSKLKIKNKKQKIGEKTKDKTEEKTLIII